MTAGSAGRHSYCAPYRDQIREKLDRGLSAQRIWQDLREDVDFAGSYESIKRYVRRLRETHPLPFRRLETPPGEEAQVDFGAGAPLVTQDGRRRCHLFRIVLSHSRKAYSEVVARQTTEAFVRALENAFWHFGGVPRVLVIDNLRAAVKKADWFDPELNPKIESFCRHYGVVMLPTRPYTPRHKGKVERGVDYAQENALKGRSFESLFTQNLFLKDWETKVADTRIHGTTRQQVRAMFERERSALQPLPANRFPFFHEGRRRVHRDGHIEVDKAYYSVPPEYMGHDVWIRWDSGLVRIYTLRMEPITVHSKHGAGQFVTARSHIASRKRSAVERSTRELLCRTQRIGPQTDRWARAMIEARGLPGIRVLVGLLALAKRHPAAHLEAVCHVASDHDAFRLRTLRELLKRHQATMEPEDILSCHPLIRSLDSYGNLVAERSQTL